MLEKPGSGQMCRHPEVQTHSLIKNPGPPKVEPVEISEGREVGVGGYLQEVSRVAGRELGSTWAPTTC